MCNACYHNPSFQLIITLLGILSSSTELTRNLPSCIISWTTQSKPTNQISFLMVKRTLDVSAAFLLFDFFFFFFFSSSLLYVKGEDEICLYQVLVAVKNRHVSSKMFWGMGYCWQPDQTYHFAIFALLLFFFFSFIFFPQLHEYIVAQKFCYSF